MPDSCPVVPVGGNVAFDERGLCVCVSEFKVVTIADWQNELGGSRAFVPIRMVVRVGFWPRSYYPAANSVRYRQAAQWVAAATCSGVFGGMRGQIGSLRRPCMLRQ